MNYTTFLGRADMESAIKDLLTQFPHLEKGSKRNIYIRGNSGVGKTTFISRILAEMDYDVIPYDTGETKNNHTIELITKNTIASTNVISSFKKETKKHVVLIDDTDSLSISDKAALTTLIKLVRPKKTKKQQTEAFNTIPIIFVGNMMIDKNLKDLIHVCHTFEMYPPTREQMTHIVKDVFPSLTVHPRDCDDLVDYLGEDLAKLSLTQEYYHDTPGELLLSDIRTLFVRKTKNTDRAQKIQQLYHHDIPLKYHSQFINETDRTTVSLLWHENVIDILKYLPADHTGAGLSPHEPTLLASATNSGGGAPASATNPNSNNTKKPKKASSSSSSSSTSKRKPSKAGLDSATGVAATAFASLSASVVPGASHSAEMGLLGGVNHSLARSLPVYVRMLDNICYSDFIDRTTFQKQVWKLNEISSIIKTFKNNHLLHLECFCHKFEASQPTPATTFEPLLPKEIRFTKILTKYSSEYNNFWFIRNLCQTLGIDKNDLLEQAIYYSNASSASASAAASSTDSPVFRHSKPSNLLELFEANEFDMTTLNRLIKYYKVCATGLLLTPNVEVEIAALPEMEIEVLH